MYSAALVDINGNISWCCMPSFDAPSIFASIIDSKIGGWFSIVADDIVTKRQMYLGDTNILVTRFSCASGVGEIVDFMPVNQSQSQIIRIVKCVRGTVQFRIECSLAPDYARQVPTVSRRKGGAVFNIGDSYSFALSTRTKLTISGSKVISKFTLNESQKTEFTLCSLAVSEAPDLVKIQNEVDAKFNQTIKYWHDWISRCTYRGRWSESVYRSALTLKLLTYQPTGAIIAAPTMGLPESIGGERNWDYRYTWIRDASFTLYAFIKIGYREEAERFMDWIHARCLELSPNNDYPLQLMYGIRGEQDLREQVLGHLTGYHGSIPVRLGNAAYLHLQLDIYGELIDTIYLYNKYVKPVSYDLWQTVRKLANWVCNNWTLADESIWETRAGRQHFVFSKLMCWVAVDRAARMSMKHSLPGEVDRWILIRDKIYDEIMNKGWSNERSAFIQHYGSSCLDASLLLMPLVKFISPQDPRMLSTVDAILNTLTSDGLVYRYDHSQAPDGLQGHEGTFSMCTFWLVECLARAGRLDEARLKFQQILNYGNHLGLFSEEIGPHGESLGNFPQGLTHLALISAACCLSRELNEHPKSSGL